MYVCMSINIYIYIYIYLFVYTHSIVEHSRAYHSRAQRARHYVVSLLGQRPGHARNIFNIKNPNIYS